MLRTPDEGSVDLLVTRAVVLDIGLPDFSGYALAKLIRETKWGENALLIAVTGWGQSEDKRRAQEAGFDHHLAKPVSAEALESALQMIKDMRTVPRMERPSVDQVVQQRGARRAE